DAILTLDKRVLSQRVGELQRLLAEADERADAGEQKRILAEQAALVDALQALGKPEEPRPLKQAVERIVVPALSTSVAAMAAQNAPADVVDTVPADPREPD